MKTYYLTTFAFLLSFSIYGQDYFIIGDSTFFNIRQRTDSAGVNGQTNIYFDIDCDGANDLKFHFGREPIPNYPGRDIKYISNIGPDTIEFAGNNIGPAELMGARWGDTIYIDSVKNWRFKPQWKIIDFSIVGCCGWPGDDYYAVWAHRLVIFYRKKVNGQYFYGWFDFDGHRSIHNLFINYHGAQKPYCDPSPVKEVIPSWKGISVFPNPIQNEFRIQLDYEPKAEFSWEIINLTGQLMTKGKNNGADFVISMDQNLPNGIYLIKVRNAMGPNSYISKIVIQN